MRFARLALSKRKNPVQSLAPKPAFVNFNAIHSLRNHHKMAAAAPSHADPAAAGAKSTYSTVTQGRFVDLPERLEFAKMEENTLKFWTEIDAFKTSLKQSEGKPRYSFYDGPPFATGLPHYGHILAGTIKDIVCRYAHQTGHHVERRFGWDCHGLPVEFEIEKKLGVKSSHDVKAMGIAKYNDECRAIVTRFAEEWETIVTRCGRWIDFKNDYKTMNLSYMESVWWVFKELHRKGLVYRGFKVMPYSTACTTPLSNFECNMNYQDVSDPSAMVSFPLVGEENTSMLAWTTTPWTLPSNLCLVVHPDFDYVTVRDVKQDKKYVFAECRLDEVYKNHAKAKEKPFEVVSKCKGKDLVGKKYEPLFPFFQELTKAFRVVADTYVTSDSGTGVVHSAPGFGEEDFRVSLANGIIDKGEIVCPIDENGCFQEVVAPFKGRYVKECDNDILDDLKKRGRLFNKAAIVHSYPFCWRSDTPLIYRAIDSWFVGVESMRDALLRNNEQTHWVPEFVKTKRFTNWLADAKDWNVSRNRYWGTPLPVWHSADWEEVVVVGSVAELEELTGAKGITDIHRQFVDELTIPSKRPGQPPLRRVPQVFDCWFESGSMPYGQHHYPFENKEKFEATFPANFIAEGLDQTRGWFYTLLVLSTALFDKPPFKNLVVNGLVLAADGKKMSKRLMNYPPVEHILNTSGADACRLFLIDSPVVRAEPLRFREDGVKKIITDLFLPLCNAVKFFVMNANHLMESEKHTVSLSTRSSNEMDRWILAAANNTLVAFVHEEMRGYRLYTVVPALVKFLDTLTNWYVRMNRRRLKGADGVADWKDSIDTLFQVLFTAAKVLAPFTPFLAEEIYQCLRPVVPAAERQDSIHYFMLPAVDEAAKDAALELSMSRMTAVIDLVRVVRDRVPGFGSVKMPLKEVVVIHPEPAAVAGLAALEHYVKRELNAFDAKFTSEEGEYVVCKLEANFKTLGVRLKTKVNEVNKALKAMDAAAVGAFMKAKGGVVAEQELTMDDVKVVRAFKDGISGYETHTDGDVLVLVNTQKDQALIDSYRAREFVSRVQKLRKEAGLVITDTVDVFYATEDAELAASLEACRAQVSETVRGTWAAGVPAGAEKVAEKEEEISGSAITVVFTKPKA